MLRLATLSAVIALSACANQGDEGFSVLNNTAVTTTCTLSGDPGQPFKAHGEINVFSPQGYLLTPLIQSRISSGGAGSGGTVDPTTRTIFLKSANVSLEVKAVSVENADGSFSTANVSLTSDQAKFSELFSASLPPAGTVNVAFEIIPVQTLRAIRTAVGETAHFRAEVLATITVIGEMNGDETVAQPFTYPVTVCTDCVIHAVNNCPTTVTPRTGNPCNPYQDGDLDCCIEADMSLTCPSRMGTAAN